MKIRTYAVKWTKIILALIENYREKTLIYIKSVDVVIQTFMHLPGPVSPNETASTSSSSPSSSATRILQLSYFYCIIVRSCFSSTAI